MPQAASSPNGEVRTITNRLKALMVHIPWYSIQGQHRLAGDCGVASSTISRLVHGQTAPSYRLARLTTDALSRRLGCLLDLREVYSTDGTYPTPRVCDLTPDCRGCFPDEAYDIDGSLRPEYCGLSPGDWCRYPSLKTPIVKPSTHK